MNKQPDLGPVRCPTCAETWPRESNNGVAVELVGECLHCREDPPQEELERIGAIARERNQTNPMGGFQRPHNPIPNDVLVKLPADVRAEIVSRAGGRKGGPGQGVPELPSTSTLSIRCASRDCKANNRGICSTPGKISINDTQLCEGFETDGTI